jgi:hypothetical protein
MPGPGVGTEAGNVGTAIDYRLRLAFTAAEPIDHVAHASILLISPCDSDARQRMRNVGEELAERLKETVLRLQLVNDLRARTRPEDCTPAPTFPTDRIAADADLAIDGLLLDFKSTRYTRTLRQAEAWQLTGYLLLDTDDRYRVDTVGLYLSRSGTLATWPVEEYLELLGACRRDVLAFRTGFTELLEGCTADVEPYDQEEEDRVRKLLQRLAPVADQGSLPGVHSALPDIRTPAPGVLLLLVPWPRPVPAQ